MARWKLRDKHYLLLNAELDPRGPVEWEYVETDQMTGRRARKLYHVPRYLDPNPVSGDCNYPGEIVVSNKPHGQDYVFVGDPTPDMEPLDDEAKAISDDFIKRGKWKHPIESLDMNYSQSMLSDWERQLAETIAKNARTAPAVEPSVSPTDFKALQEQVAALMKQNAELKARRPA